MPVAKGPKDCSKEIMTVEIMLVVMIATIFLARVYSVVILVTEQKDVQQTIHDAEMETEQIIECTTTETSNVTKTSFFIDRPAHEILGRGRAKMAVPRSPDTE